MRTHFKYSLAVTSFAIVMGLLAQVADSASTITTTSETVCLSSDGLPDHATGTFPNKGNPNSIRVQDISFCVPTSPEKSSRAQSVQVVGIATNGILIRPGTADYYDASSSRGHSRDSASGWNLDGMGAREMLGLDTQNAHVDNRGIYHYHGMPPALNTTDASTLVGYAADGFEIHYVGDTARPSYMLRAGLRPTEPGGAYDGTYKEDFEFVRGYGNLDECNGASLNGSYVYFATDAYPYFPRCLWGTNITRVR